MFKISEPRQVDGDTRATAAAATDILGFQVTCADAHGCVVEVRDWIEKGDRCRWAACINPHSYVVAGENAAFREALLDADWLLPDGAGILLAARLLGEPIRRRVTGSDLFDGLHRHLSGADRMMSVFLLGSTEDTLARVADRLAREYPRVRVAGTYSPPFASSFTAEQDEAMVEAVNAAHADVLWVSMTAPKQELWLHRNRGRLEVRFAAAVGAVFDFYIGKVKRSHPIAQRLGLEWLPRLVREPRRLWRRTFVSAPRFLLDAVKESVRRRWGASGSAPAGGRASRADPTHVVVALPVLLVGGTEIQTLELVRALVRHGYRVTVCCYHEYDEGMVDRFRVLGAEVVLLGWSRDRPLWRFVLALRKVFAAWRPDIVHVQYMAPALAAVLAARLAGAPRVLVTMHTAGYGLRVRLLVRIARWLSDAFICVSANLERFWCGASAVPDPAGPRTRRRHQTIHNCVDVDGLMAVAGRADRPALRSSLSLGDGPIVGVVGRLRSEKGQRVLLAALPRVLQAIPGAQVLVVGDGPDRADLAQLADRLGIGDHVRWTGHLAPERVAETYPLMDVLAVPSEYEGFGLVAAEAMALGLPVVATDTEGLSEVVVDGKTGLIVPVGDTVALADALLRILKDPVSSKAMGERGAARARECFSRERFEVDVLGTYQRVQEGH